MSGTLLNAAGIALGAALGLLLRRSLPEHVRSAVEQALGLAVLVIGLQMALQSKSPVLLLLSLVLGAWAGAALGLERRLQGLAEAPSRTRTAPKHGGDGQTDSMNGWPRALVTSSLVFCVGPMAILGAIQDGLSGDYSLLAVKAWLDFFSALAFAATLGVGVLLSSLAVLLYQGAITLLAAGLRQTLTEPLISEMTASGGVLIVALGLQLLGIKKLDVANLLPALVFAPLLAAAMP